VKFLPVVSRGEREEEQRSKFPQTANSLAMVKIESGLWVKRWTSPVLVLGR